MLKTRFWFVAIEILRPRHEKMRAHESFLRSRIWALKHRRDAIVDKLFTGSRCSEGTTRLSFTVTKTLGTWRNLQSCLNEEREKPNIGRDLKNASGCELFPGAWCKTKIEFVSSFYLRWRFFWCKESFISYLVMLYKTDDVSALIPSTCWPFWHYRRSELVINHSNAEKEADDQFQLFRHSG